MWCKRTCVGSRWDLEEFVTILHHSCISGSADSSSDTCLFFGRPFSGILPLNLQQRQQKMSYYIFYLNCKHVLVKVISTLWSHSCNKQKHASIKRQIISSSEAHYKVIPPPADRPSILFKLNLFLFCDIWLRVHWESEKIFNFLFHTLIFFFNSMYFFPNIVVHVFII